MAEELLIPETPTHIVTVPAAGIRYLTPIFTSWITEIGEYQPGFKVKVYMPANDTIDRRPVVIVYSGGGTLDIDATKSTCEELVKLGYVVVAGQYKQTVGDFTTEEQKQAVVNTYNLINYIRENYEKYGVKKKKFFGIGTSAGALTLIQAGITGNDTQNPYYTGYAVPNIKGCLLATASLSGAANPQYMDLIQTGGVQNNFYNGKLDPIIPYKQAEATFNKEIALGIPSQIKIYDNADHTLGEHDDIFYNPVYGIIPTFYNKLYQKAPQP